MKKLVANVSASVRQRLLNLAMERNEDFGLVLTRYGLERFLYRLSISPHRDTFVLKGALLLQLWTAEIYRPTRDLDLLGRGPSDINFRRIFNVVDDGLTFLPKTIRVDRIRDEEGYEGVRVRVEARLGDARIPLQIDVGLGDTIVPASWLKDETRVSFCLARVTATFNRRRPPSGINGPNLKGTFPPRSFPYPMLMMIASRSSP